MTKKEIKAEIKAEIKDLNEEIKALESQPADAIYWPEWERTRDLEGLRAKREQLIAKL